MKDKYFDIKELYGVYLNGFLFSYITKKGGKRRHNWKKRWFSVGWEFIVYFDESFEELGKISIKEIESVGSSVKSPIILQVDTPKRKWLMKMSSVHTLRFWERALTTLKAMHHNNAKSDKYFPILREIALGVLTLNKDYYMDYFPYDKNNALRDVSDLIIDIFYEFTQWNSRSIERYDRVKSLCSLLKDLIVGLHEGLTELKYQIVCRLDVIINGDLDRFKPIEENRIEEVENAIQVKIAEDDESLEGADSEEEITAQEIFIRTLQEIRQLFNYLIDKSEETVLEMKEKVVSAMEQYFTQLSYLKSLSVYEEIEKEALVWGDTYDRCITVLAKAALRGAQIYAVIQEKCDGIIKDADTRFIAMYGKAISQKSFESEFEYELSQYSHYQTLVPQQESTTKLISIAELVLSCCKDFYYKSETHDFVERSKRIVSAMESIRGSHEPDDVIYNLASVIKKFAFSFSDVLEKYQNEGNHDSKSIIVTTNLIRELNTILVSCINSYKSEEVQFHKSVNIWEPEESPIIYMSNNQSQIRAATLNQLVINLTSWKDVDIDFMKTFILTYRSFTSPDVLFEKIVERFYLPKFEEIGMTVEDFSEFSKDAYYNKVVKAVRLRTCNVMIQWTDSCSTNDLSIDLMDKIVDFCCDITKDADYEKMYESFVKKILKNISELRSRRKTKRKSSLQNYNFLYTQDPISNKQILPREIAEQMTLVDMTFYTSIQPVELLNQCWTKEKLKYRCPNVLALISRFNAVSSWTASNILWQEVISRRSKIFMKFIQIAKDLFDIRNFHSCMAVIAGLNSASVSRLKFTKNLSKNHMKTLNILEEQLNASGAYKNYRELIRTSAPPLIPYIGVYLGDLIFLEEGNPDEIDGLINFDKLRGIYNTLIEVRQYQHEEYPFTTIPTLTNYLSHLPFASDTELFDLSLLREPRGATKVDII